MPEAKLLCVGESLIDVIDRDGAVDESVGGSPLNVACGLAALGHSIALATWIGRDARGAQIAEHLSNAGVELAPGSQGSERTSVARAEIDASGAASYRFELDWQLPDLGRLADFGHIHTGSIGALLPPGGHDVRQLLEEHQSRCTISYDPNARPALMGEAASARAEIEQRIRFSDVVKASDEDIAWCYEDENLPANLEGLTQIAFEWLQLGASLVVITRGGRGALACLAAEPEAHLLAPLSVEVTDTVGAGDSFMAGLLSGLIDAGLLAGVDAKTRLAAAGWAAVEPALQRAARTSGITVTKRGAYSPSRDEIDEA